MENQLKRRLIEQCSGFPWLLKKLSIHIFRQVKKGIKQTDLIFAQFNLKQLFDEDTIDLTVTQTDCLKYIAKYSPISVVELNERFDSDTINELYKRRLLIRAGHRYAIYWDIFRDYINEGKLPIIPLTVIPISPLGTIIKSIQIFDKYDKLSKDEFAHHMQIADNTATNVISDLITFLIIKKDDENQYHLTEEIRGKSIDEIAQHLYQQFSQHKIIQELLNYEGDGARIPIEKFQTYLAHSYSSLGLSPQSINSYSTKLLRWFAFCGLIEIDYNHIVFIKSGSGSQKGSLSGTGNRKTANRQSLFLASSSPENVIKLLACIQKGIEVNRIWIKSHKLRNAAYDATSLNILSWQEGKLVISDKYSGTFSKSKDNKKIEDILKDEVNQSYFISQLKQYINSSKTISQIGDEISRSIGRTWAEKSKNRYILSAVKWMKYLNKNKSA